MSKTTPNEKVTQTRHDEILVVTINNPPVNALNVDVRRGLVDAIEVAEADSTIKAVLLVGAGRNFIGGADIKEFGKPRLPPTLPDVCNCLESCHKLLIAAIHGVALGGGLEVALSAHYRLAVEGAKLGFPEVTLGILPGAGGTQRAPRVMGVVPALDLMLSGRRLSAHEALGCGLIDRLEKGDPLESGLTYAKELLAGHADVRRTCDMDMELSPNDVTAFAALKAETAKRTRGLFSPMKIIESVQAGLDLSFGAALKKERELFLECMSSPQRAALIHAFFAERAAAKAPEMRAAQPRIVAKVGVVGGGTMGVGITVALLNAGLKVTLVERDGSSLASSRANIEKIYDGLVAKGRVSNAARTEQLNQFSGATTCDVLADADLVIEAIFEDMDAKKTLFGQLDRVCKPGAVLATNTSYLDINVIADAVSRPADVIGLHFFSPAHVMKLLEVVVPARVAPEVVATGFALAQRLKKTPIRAGVCDGFIGNRILSAYRQALDYLLEDGASPYQIDRAICEFGCPMGPFQVSDLAGGDIGWATRKRRAATRDPKARYVHIADRLCERGWFGQKTGRGWYRYAEGARVGTEDPEVLAIVEEERRKAGIEPRQFSDEDILRRYLAAMINEGANVVHEGIALRPSDVDVAMLYGYGFPRYRGGPMYYADSIGIAKVLTDIQAFAQEDPLFWQPSPLLLDLVKRDSNFQSLNKG